MSCPLPRGRQADKNGGDGTKPALAPSITSPPSPPPHEKEATMKPDPTGTDQTGTDQDEPIPVDDLDDDEYFQRYN